MLEYLLPGILIGLSSGFAPGPLMTLVVSQTLRHGLKEGIKVSLAPFFTDIPIILIIIISLSFFKDISFFLGLISFLGAGYLIYLTYESFKIKGFIIDGKDVKPQSFSKGIITNLLNPHPYLFYFTVGGPLILRSYQTNLLYSFIFVGAFLICLVASKVVLAFIAERSRSFFKSALYITINRILGLLMFGFAVKLISDGVHFFI